MTWHHCRPFKSGLKHLWMLGVLAPFALPFAVPTSARAEVPGQSERLATESSTSYLFPVNPSNLKPVGARAAGLLLQNRYESKLDHESEGGDSVVAKTTDEGAAAGSLVDLGAGAGLGLSHRVIYRKTQTSLGSDRSSADPRSELAKTQESQVRIVIELTEELQAGVAIRYLFKDTTVLGDPSIGAANATRYKSTLVGYGAGATYRASGKGFAYTYYPPLRGKTEVYGEEKIVVERGLISLDGFVKASEPWTFGLLAQRWLGDLDDLAKGTTAADNRTNISLFGLDPDQYAVAKQLWLLGLDYSLSGTTLLRASFGQGQDELNFRDMRIFSRAGVRARGDNPLVTSNRLRLGAHFNLKGEVKADLGMGFFDRTYEFSDDMNGGSYKSSGREMYASIGLGI